MNDYLIWDTKIIKGNDKIEHTLLYDKGYVFTRKSKGEMYKTRSLRIILKEFDLNSENRRVLKHTQGLELSAHVLPLQDYDWHIHKMGKDFYSTKFPNIKFSASKIKSLITSYDSNFNTLLKYSYQNEAMGYAITYENTAMMHYSYPFYDLKYNNNFGMGMMLNAILYALDLRKQYIYLGSVSRPTDIYKLQFKGLEWFDGNDWNKDLESLKLIVKE